MNFRDYDRRTALHVASSEGRLDVVKYLVSKGAKVNRSDRWGGSPLDDAHRHRHTEVAKYLRGRGARYVCSCCLSFALYVQSSLDIYNSFIRLSSGSLNLTTNLISAAAAGDIEGR